MSATPLPTGIVTFLFSDIEGSTKLTERLGASRYGSLLELHRRALREAFGRHGGIEVGTEGDSFFVVFENPVSAVAAASDGQRALAATGWPDGAVIRVRMGIHTGEGVLVDGSYVGPDVNRAARIAGAGHGGQVLVSEATTTLVGGTLPDGVQLRTLGEHRLKDLRSERLCQLDVAGLPTAFAPIRSLDARPNNLPTQLTSFVGRQREVSAVLRLLETARLVTLTGPGGTGKTRLGLQVAAESVGRFADGVTFVPLATITDPGLVASTIASAIGLPDTGGRPPRDRLVDHLRDREHLLFLDNFEQVTAAAPLVADLLREAPRLQVLVSSRIILRLSGEQEYPVPPLELPDGTRGRLELEALSLNPAVELFVDRARAVRPDFALGAANAQAVASIVARLDGLPLAIELAAARSRLLTPDAMLKRLTRRLDLLQGAMRDLPERQQTLRGAIAWSHDLLSPPERRLFARFSVFVGGAALAEAEEVCGPPEELGRDVLDGMEALVEHSLVRPVESKGEPRFAMLATIGEFAAEQLAASGERDEIRRRHAATFLALAERAAPELTASDRRAWLDRLEEELDNLRAVRTWAVETGDAETGLRLVAAVWRFWQSHGHLAEGRDTADVLLALTAPPALDDIRLAALEAAGGICYWQGDFIDAGKRYAEVLEIRRGRSEPGPLAEALYNLSFIELFGNADTARAEELGREALELYRGLGDRPGIAKAQWELANVARDRHDVQAARGFLAEAIPALRSLEDAFLLGWALFTSAQVEARAGDLELSHARYLEALGIWVDAGDRSGIVLVLDGLAIDALLEGDPERAARLSGAVAALEKSTGTGLNPANRVIFGFDPAVLRDDPGTSAAWQDGTQLTEAEAIAYARTAPAVAHAAGESRTVSGT